MLEIMIAIFLGLACPGHTSTTANTPTTQDVPPDTGGDQGHIPPK